MYNYEKPSTGSCIKAEVSNAGAILEDAKNLGRWGLTERGRPMQADPPLAPALLFPWFRSAISWGALPLAWDYGATG